MTRVWRCGCHAASARAASPGSGSRHSSRTAYSRLCWLCGPSTIGKRLASPCERSSTTGCTSPSVCAATPRASPASPRTGAPTSMLSACTWNVSAADPSSSTHTSMHDWPLSRVNRRFSVRIRARTVGRTCAVSDARRVSTSTPDAASALMSRGRACSFAAASVGLSGSDVWRGSAGRSVRGTAALTAAPSAEKGASAMSASEAIATASSSLARWSRLASASASPHGETMSTPAPRASDESGS